MPVSRRVIVNNQTGLHARPASLFVQKANQYQAEIQVIKGGTRVNAKSIMSIMGLGVEAGSEIVIKASGPGAERAVEELAVFIEEELPEADKG